MVARAKANDFEKLRKFVEDNPDATAPAVYYERAARRLGINRADAKYLLDHIQVKFVPKPGGGYSVFVARAA